MITMFDQDVLESLLLWNQVKIESNWETERDAQAILLQNVLGDMVRCHAYKPNHRSVHQIRN